MMKIVIVAPDADKWDLGLPNVEIVPPRRYITDPRFLHYGRCRVLNLCRSYQYQSSGYYVSLLATARGHRPTPSVSTMRDLHGGFFANYIDSELEEQYRRA